MMPHSTQTAFFDHYQRAGFWALIGVLALLSYSLGTIASLVINILAILLLPSLFSADIRREISRQPLLLFVLVPVLLLLAFTITAQKSVDVGNAVAFLPFMLAIPILAIAGKYRSQHTITTFLSLCLLGSLVAVAVGLYDLQVRELTRAEGVLTGAIVYGRMAFLLGMVAGAGILAGRNPWRFVFCLGPILGTIAITLSGARGIAIAAPFLYLTLICCTLMREAGRARYFALIIFALIASITTLIVFSQFNATRVLSAFSSIWNVFSGGNVTDPNILTRLDFYHAGWALFLEHPLFGIGWYRPELVMQTIQAQSQNPSAKDFFAFHNDFLQLAASAGLLGIAAYVLLFAAPLISLGFSPRDRLFPARLYLILAIVILYAISGLSDVVFGYDMPTTAYAMMCAIVLGLFREKDIPAKIQAGR